MPPIFRRSEQLWPALGCLGVLAALSLVILLPLLLADVMTTALTRLHLTPGMALLAVLGIFAGSLVNVPLYRVERTAAVPLDPFSPLGLWGFWPQWRRERTFTDVSINVGGGIVPSMLALWQFVHLLHLGGWPLGALALTTITSVVVCWKLARPVPGIGILLPGFVAPLTSVGMTWLLLSDPAYAAQQPPVAFVAGVAGPLLGADLLHLRQLTRMATGQLSIGGAGTFDGIVLSGVLAALLV